MCQKQKLIDHTEGAPHSIVTHVLLPSLNQFKKKSKFFQVTFSLIKTDSKTERKKINNNERFESLL